MFYKTQLTGDLLADTTIQPYLASQGVLLPRLTGPLTLTCKTSYKSGEKSKVGEPWKFMSGLGFRLHILLMVDSDTTKRDTTLYRRFALTFTTNDSYSLQLRA